MATVINDQTQPIQPQPQAARPSFVARRVALALAVLSVLLTSILAGYFVYQSRYYEGFRYFPFKWTTHWITTPYLTSKTGCFRKTFFIDGAVDRAYIAVTGDNFYGITVNAQNPHDFFRPSMAQTLTGAPTTYNGLGFDRNFPLAHIYDMTRYLRPGKNVIAVYVQTDGQRPRLAIQGMYRTTRTYPIQADTTWKCAPVEQTHNRLSWQVPAFRDYDWVPAVDAGPVTGVAVDGDPNVFCDPLKGYVVQVPNVSNPDSITFRTFIDVPGRASDGYFRVAASRNYDLLLNGVMIGGTAAADRYSRSVLGRQGFFDTFGRMQNKAQDIQYIPIQREGLLTCYELKNFLHSGRNELTVTMHADNPFPQYWIPRVYCDGRLTLMADGSQREFHTDAQSWQASVQPGVWQNVQIASRPGPWYLRYGKANIGGRIDPGGLTYWHMARNDAVLFVVLMIAAYFIGRLIQRIRPERKTGLATIIASLFGVESVALLTVFYLQAEFVNSPQDQFFISTDYGALALVVGLAAFVLAFAVIIWPNRTEAATERIGMLEGVEVASTDAAAPRRSKLRAFADRYGYAIAMAVVMTVAGVFYVHGIAVDSILPDEYVSILAARGILQHGVPMYPTHIVYTRSSLYHYLLAAWMCLFQNDPSLGSTRLLSVMWQFALLPLVYFFGRMVKSRAAGLVAVLLVAFSPGMFYVVREARFYLQFTFFTTLCFYYLWKSINDPEQFRYRVYFALAYAAAYLSQQFAMTIIPTTILIVLLAGQIKYWLQWRTLALIGFDVAVMAFDLLWYLKCGNTSLPYVDTDSVLQLAVHTDILEVLPSTLLLSDERGHFAIGLLFLGGLAWIIYKLFNVKRSSAEPKQAFKWEWWNYLYTATAVMVVATTLIASRPATRYVIHIFPLAALCAGCAAVEFGAYVYRLIRRNLDSAAFARFARVAYAASLAILCLAAFRPVRMWNASVRDINRDNAGGARYVRSHMLPGDKVMFFSPEISMVELGKCDYMWRPRHSSIFKFVSRDGVLRERNSGAVVVDNPDKLRRIMAENDRIWLVIYSGHLGQAGPDYTGAMAAIVTNNWKLEAEPFNMQVLLWDKHASHYQNTVRGFGFDSLSW